MPAVELIGDQGQGHALGFVGGMHARGAVNQGQERGGGHLEDLGEPVVGRHPQAEGAGVEVGRPFQVVVIEEGVAGRDAIRLGGIQRRGLLGA